MSSVVKKVVKPFAKKALKSGISKAGDQISNKMAEKSGDLIMKRLRNMRQRTVAPILNKGMPPTIKNKQQKESTDMIIYID